MRGGTSSSSAAAVGGLKRRRVEEAATTEPAPKRPRVAKLKVACEGVKRLVDMDCAEDDDFATIRQALEAKAGVTLRRYTVHVGTMTKCGPALDLGSTPAEAGLDDGSTIVFKKPAADAGAVVVQVT